MSETAPEKPVKTCLECGEPLGPGREDRKFCSDACRTAFNNKRRKEPLPEPAGSPDDRDWRPGFYERINRIIRRNRDIMEYLCETDNRSIEKHDLEGYGFNFKYFSSEYLDPERGSFRFCYDHGYRVYNDRHVQLISRTDEILC